jgi:DNA-binding NtrC family response regulator
MSRDPKALLLVERDGDSTEALIAFLERHEIEVIWVRDGKSALRALERDTLHALAVALRAPEIDGLAVLRRARERHPHLCAVAIASAGGAGRAGVGSELADEAVRLGAADVQPGPIHPDRLLAVLERGFAEQRTVARVTELEQRLDERFGFERLEAHSPAMRRVIEQVRQVATTRAPVLIEGEPGTGRSRLAEVIHHHGPRRAARFVRMSCVAAAPEVIERELFGVEAGADQAAEPGRLELADSGTLFLENVESAPAPVQLRLLRFLQDRAFERVGGAESRRADVRLIASTSADLASLGRDGRFREDLAARLSIVRVRMPSLSARLEDLPLLVASFIRDFNREHGRRVSGATPGVIERLSKHAWPNNVRELRDTIEGMVVFTQGRRALDLSDLPQAIRSESAAEGEGRLIPGMTVEEAERALIEATLRHTGYDKTRAASMLGIGLRTLYRKITRYGLETGSGPR